MTEPSQIADKATPTIRGNPTAEHAGGNACVVSSQFKTALATRRTGSFCCVVYDRQLSLLSSLCFRR